MKISNRNTAIELLEDKIPQFTICWDGEHDQEYISKFGLSVQREWHKAVSFFRRRIQYISDPFYQAFHKAAPKLKEVLLNEPMEEIGTFICRAGPGETNTFFYFIDCDLGGENAHMNYALFCFSKETCREKPALAMYCSCSQDSDKKITTKEYFSETAKKNGVNAISFLADMMELNAFLKYCELETKFVEPGKKVIHAEEKYVNETKSRVEILDSNWFTTIIRSEGFRVGGHFRLQPYGPGMSSKKLIWIAPYDKHGYTRTAKFLRDGRTEQS